MKKVIIFLVLMLLIGGLLEVLQVDPDLSFWRCLGTGAILAGISIALRELF